MYYNEEHRETNKLTKDSVKNCPDVFPCFLKTMDAAA